MYRVSLALLFGAGVLVATGSALADPPPAFAPQAPNMPIVGETTEAPPAYGQPGYGLEKEKAWKEKHKDWDKKEKLKDKEKSEKDKEKLDHDKAKAAYDKKWHKPGWKDPQGPPPGFDREKARLNALKEREALKKKLAAKEPSPEMREELQVHAHRIAELNRISELATANSDTATAARVTKLIVRENARHRNW